MIQEVQEHGTVDAHVGAPEAHAAEGCAGAHAEEWGADAMLHHVQDASYWDLSPLGCLEFPTFPAFQVAGITIDLSITKHVLFLMLASLGTIATMWIAARASARLDHAAKAPRGTLNIVEAFYLFIRDEVVMANIGRGGERFAPLIITLFFFILYANLLGLLPWGATATGNIMVTGALALVALVVIESAGFAALGPKGYAKTIFFLPPGLPGPLKPVLLAVLAPVEFIGKFSKIIALAIRLFANMTAGHFVVLALMGLIVTYGSFTHPVGLVSIAGSLALGLFVMLLEIFIAFVQAYIFAMLVAVFTGLIRHAH